jgi:hypothetical protein
MNPVQQPGDGVMSALTEFAERQHAAVENLKVSYQKLLELYEKERQQRLQYEKMIHQMYSFVETNTTPTAKQTKTTMSRSVPQQEQQLDTSAGRQFTAEEREIIWQFGCKHQPKIPWTQLLPRFPGRKSTNLGKCFQYMKTTRHHQDDNTAAASLIMMEEEVELSLSEDDD